MNELVVIVEGETEQAFVKGQLAEHLSLCGTNTWPVLSGRRRLEFPKNSARSDKSVNYI